MIYSSVHLILKLGLEGYFGGACCEPLPSRQEDDRSIGSRADLKRGLSFAASLRLARNVSWSQWRAIEKDPKHIEEVLTLCSETCHKELDADWGPYRFCLARHSPDLVPSFLLDRAAEAWGAAAGFHAHDFINAAVRASRDYWSHTGPSSATPDDRDSPKSNHKKGRLIPTDNPILLCSLATASDFRTFWKHNYLSEDVARRFSADGFMQQCITSSQMWQSERSRALPLSYCMTGASLTTPGDILLVFVIGYSSWLCLIGASYLGMAGVFSPDRESVQRLTNMLPSLGDGVMSSQHWYLNEAFLMFNTSAPGDDVLMEFWVGSEVGLGLLASVSLNN